MEQLISRQQAIDAFNTGLNELVVAGEENAKTVENYLNGVIEKIKCLPSAQPERKTGKWIDETFKPWGLVYHPYKCDQCGEHSEADSNYCPNCGADMRGEQDDKCRQV